MKPLAAGYQIGGPQIGGAAGKAPHHDEDASFSKNERKGESKMYAFGGGEGLESEAKQADRKPRRNQAKEDDVQIMKF